MAGSVQRQGLTDRWFYSSLAGLTVIGMVVRVGYLVARDNPPDAGEAQNVAMAIAAGRGVSDAYFVGSGPTAHLTPTMTAIAGGVHALFGDGSAAAMVLETLVLALVFGSFWLMALATVEFGLPRRAAVGAFAVLAAVPLFLRFETFWFRYWEGALAVCLQSLVFVALAWSGRAGRRWPVPVLATGPGVLGFTLPPLGLAAVAMIAVALGWQRQWRRLALVGVGIFITSGVLFTPWVVRNMAVMHRPILLRSNLGLELALGAGAPIDNAPDYIAKTILLHPFQDGPGRSAYRLKGELGYFDGLLSDTTAWIAGHKRDYAGLLLRHARQTVVAEPFEFGLIDGGHPGLRMLMYDLVAVLGIAGFGYGAWRIDWRLGLPLIQVAVLAVCYAPFQPISRYLYVDYTPLMFGAALFVSAASQVSQQALARVRTRAM